jgi:hypothetical protein
MPRGYDDTDENGISNALGEIIAVDFNGILNGVANERGNSFW